MNEKKQQNSPMSIGSSAVICSGAIPGLTDVEADEYRNYLTYHINEITQEDWQRFHDLNAKYIDALVMPDNPEHKMRCEKCGERSPRKEWKDVGTCYDGCCDKYKCPKCGHDQLFET